MGDREDDDEEHAEDDQHNDEYPYPPEDEDQNDSDVNDSDVDDRNDRTDSRRDGFFDHPDEFGIIVPDDNVF